MFGGYRITVSALVYLLYYLMSTAGEEVVKRQELVGNTVIINTGLTAVQSDVQIMWFYGPENADTVIVNSHVFTGEIKTDYKSDRFRDRLQLDRSTASLTIRNISTEDSGVYKLEITAEKRSVWSFSVKVYAPVSKPVIRNQTEKRSRSLRESCFPLCSVKNGKDVNLSWYKDKERISSISSSDSSDSLHLPLNITHPNNYTYICVVVNPVSNQTAQLNITELCYNKKATDENRKELPKVLTAVLIPFILLVTVLLILLWCWKNNRKKQVSKDPELTYAELETKHQNSREAQIKKNSPEMTEVNDQTDSVVYSTVK